MTRSDPGAHSALFPGARMHANPSAVNTPARLVYALIGSRLSADSEIGKVRRSAAGGSEFSFFVVVVVVQLVFSTPLSFKH